jgi:SAM-dependent methyltransferase
MEALTRHLDLGCGGRPRNPLQRDKLFGIDIRRDVAGSERGEVIAANLSIDPIPFPDNYFDSVSAYDFLEHVPRILLGGETGTRFPFVELMDEIWRVLKPNGVLYALTPAWPNGQAFQDPTHVNFVTKNTSVYFSHPDPWARAYGFQGAFIVDHNDWVLPYDWYQYDPYPSWSKRYRKFWRGTIKGELTHLLWYWRAVKNPI